MYIQYYIIGRLTTRLLGNTRLQELMEWRRNCCQWLATEPNPLRDAVVNGCSLLPASPASPIDPSSKTTFFWPFMQFGQGTLRNILPVLVRQHYMKNTALNVSCKLSLAQLSQASGNHCRLATHLFLSSTDWFGWLVVNKNVPVPHIYIYTQCVYIYTVYACVYICNIYVQTVYIYIYSVYM